MLTLRVIAQASSNFVAVSWKYLLYTFIFLTIWKQNKTFWNHITWFNHKTIQPGINTKNRPFLTDGPSLNMQDPRICSFWKLIIKNKYKNKNKVNHIDTMISLDMIVCFENDIIADTSVCSWWYLLVHEWYYDLFKKQQAAQIQLVLHLFFHLMQLALMRQHFCVYNKTDTD